MMPGRDLEQPADLKVLARLGHDRLVGGDDEHRQVDAAGAGEHVLDEPLVPGHVHEGEVQPPASRCANPRSMVIPRACSSFSRSGSVPVSARTSALFP